ncbi:M48 family metallopeptidase [Dactylosporangium fulvum]|uniref:M48 family metallopeptidase n=1 Tax=Dactylosporangium fulvum TaxID=53359 RepID=A0ABY5W2H3_9ACTN|nr:M48 family metallopeptidase [Dactylosporangium fulvum]UWP83249.1 M48 family metallopeptidase [Dactylosporangium fulvum]
MKTTIRAALSVGLLAGFYLLAVGLIGGLGWLTVWLWREHPGAAAGKLSYLTIAVAIGLVVAFWKILRAKPEEPGGLLLAPHEARELWDTAHDLAHQVGTRAPDEIRLVPDVNAAVAEQTRFMGLAGGRRIMYVGMPLIQAFSVAQLRSVLAHELGHYSGSHTRIGALAHRGRMAIVQTIVQIGPSTLVGRIFRLYARIYILVEQAVSRRMEYEADEFSVRVAGRAAAISSMRDIPVIDSAWDFFVNQYVTIGWDAKLAPRDVFGGFGELLRGRAEELARLRTEAPPSEKSRWDSHPPIADRIAAMSGMPESGAAVDDRPATVLLNNAAELAARLQHEALAIEGRTLLPWDELTDTAIAANAQRDIDVLFRAAARLGGAPQGDLGLVLSLVEQGRAADLARAVAPHADADELLPALAAEIGGAVAIAARAEGIGSWRHSWSSGADFAKADGSPIPIGEVARLAVDPATVAEARQRLAGLGINVAAVRQQSAGATATGAEVLGGIANMKSGKQHFDVFILSNGLLLVPGPKKTDDGKQRLITVLRSAPVEELARQHRFLAFEDIAAATILKLVPVRVAITLHSGETVELHQPWTGEALDKNDDDLLRGALEPFVVEPQNA